jgi:hypothetical protein
MKTMEDYQKLKEIVVREYLKKKYHIDKEIDETRQQAIEEANSRGMLHSSFMGEKIAQLEIERTKKLCFFYFKEFIENFRRLGEKWNKEFSDLVKNETFEIIEREQRQSGETIQTQVEKFLKASDAPPYINMFRGEIDQLKREVEYDLEIKALETDIGLHDQEILPSQVINLNINESLIASLNLGTIVGNIDNNIGSIEKAGYADIATAIKELTEALVNAKDISETDKKEFMEQIEVLSDQANHTKSERKIGVIKAIWDKIEHSIGISANLLTIWQTVREPIMKFFGIN